jgi:hypothetical protein
MNSVIVENKKYSTMKTKLQERRFEENINHTRDVFNGIIFYKKAIPKGRQTFAQVIDGTVSDFFDSAQKGDFFKKFQEFEPNKYFVLDVKEGDPIQDVLKKYLRLFLFVVPNRTWFYTISCDK